MMNENNTGQYTLGRGRWFFDLFKAGTNYGTGERYFGNTPEASLAVASEKLDHFFADSGVRQKDLTVLLETSRSGSFTTDVISPETLALYFMGELTTLATLGITGHREAITSWARGRQFQIGNSDATPTGMRHLNNFKLFKAPSATVVDLTQALTGQAGVDEVDMAGNYEVDLELGRLYIEPTASLTGDIKLLVETDVEASTRKMVISANDMLYGSLRYISDNPVGDQQDYYWPKVALTPDGDYTLKGDEWQAIGFTFDVLTMVGRKACYVDVRSRSEAVETDPSTIRTVNLVPAKVTEAHGTPITLTATVRDGNNVVVSGAQVTFTATNSGILTPTTANTGPNGVATATVDLAAAGTTVVTATVQGASGPVSAATPTITFS